MTNNNIAGVLVCLTLLAGGTTADVFANNVTDVMAGSNLTTALDPEAGGSNLTTAQINDVMSELRDAGLDVTRDDTGLTVSARMKMSDFMFNPLMFVPSLIAWGFAPILLANLQLFVFQALMINKMALSSALYMTLRNIVFGPRPGNFVKYANFGYGHHHNHRRRTSPGFRM